MAPAVALAVRLGKHWPGRGHGPASAVLASRKNLGAPPSAGRAEPEVRPLRGADRPKGGGAAWWRGRQQADVRFAYWTTRQTANAGRRWHRRHMTSPQFDAGCAGPAAQPKLLDRVRDAVRLRHYSRRTEDAYHDERIAIRALEIRRKAFIAPAPMAPFLCSSWTRCWGSFFAPT